MAYIKASAGGGEKLVETTLFETSVTSQAAQGSLPTHNVVVKITGLK